MFSRSTISSPAFSPLPAGFLDWQVQLRAHTARERNGAPHAGVAPLAMARRPGVPLGVAAHSIICGILPHPSRLAAKTREFQAIYEGGVALGARDVYDRGLAYLKDYYLASEDFDPESLTTLMAEDRPLVKALLAEPECALLFYVFDLQDRTEVGRFRCLQLNCRAEVLTAGPVFENVWWHNTLFHGKAEESVVIHFRHQTSYNTQFGGFERLAAD
jgi:hypothetical protein